MISGTCGNKINERWHKNGRRIENYIMKSIVVTLVAFLGLLTFTNCTAQTKSSENVRREWMLVEFQDFTKDLMVKNKANLNLTNTTETGGKFTAKMGCNGMFGAVKFKGNDAVEFSQVGSTMMFCDKNMDLESAFGKELPKMTKYKLKGHFLTLWDKTGNKMKFLAADWD